MPDRKQPGVVAEAAALVLRCTLGLVAMEAALRWYGYAFPWPWLARLAAGLAGAALVGWTLPAVRRWARRPWGRWGL